MININHLRAAPSRLDLIGRNFSVKISPVLFMGFGLVFIKYGVPQESSQSQILFTNYFQPNSNIFSSFPSIIYNLYADDV